MQEQITFALGQLISWLETWRTSDGAYNGFVVHRTESKRMYHIHDTAWTQSAMVRGYGNLFRKSKEPRWYRAMVDAADLLASRYNSSTGRIHHTGHEDERFQSLVHCALAVCALLDVSDLVDSSRREKYTSLSVDHVNRYWKNILWVEAEGAFKFAEVDYYSCAENRFVVNFNTMAVEALVRLFNITGDIQYKAWFLRIGEWLVKRWKQTQEYNELLLKGCESFAENLDSDWMPLGGFPYQFTESLTEPDNYVTLYIGLSLRGFCKLYEATEDERYAEIVRSQYAFLLAMREPSTHLFFHTTKQGKTVKYPLFIAGTGMLLVGLYEAMAVVESKTLPEDTLQSILSRAYSNGSYPGFIGKNKTVDRAGDGEVWEDMVASTNWNAQLFEYLSLLVDDPALIEVKKCNKTERLVTRRFAYFDSPTTAKIISWFPVRSWGLYMYTKKRSTAKISIYPVQIYTSLRRLMKRLVA